MFDLLLSYLKNLTFHDILVSPRLPSWIQQVKHTEYARLIQNHKSVIHLKIYFKIKLN